VHLKGKQRLFLIGLVVLVLVGGFAIVSAHQSSPKAAPQAVAGGNINGQTTATKEEVDKLKSYSLVAGELPSGSELRIGEELRNYAAGAGEQQAAEKGRIDGYYQVWLQTTAQLQFTATFDLYNNPSSAMAILRTPVGSADSSSIEPLPDPKLGDMSRMYAFMTSQGGAKYQGWAVQWVRGRTVLEVTGLGPSGELQRDEVFTAAQHVDERAKKAPIN
jgi:hypothetical protein